MVSWVDKTQQENFNHPYFKLTRSHLVSMSYLELSQIKLIRFPWHDAAI